MRNRDLDMETVLSPAFLKIWDNSLMGVMIIDRNGVYQYMNRLLIRTDDLQDVDVIGTKMVDLYPLERDCHLSIQTLETARPIIKKTIVYYTRKKKAGQLPVFVLPPDVQREAGRGHPFFFEPADQPAPS